MGWKSRGLDYCFLAGQKVIGGGECIGIFVGKKWATFGGTFSEFTSRPWACLLLLALFFFSLYRL